MSGQQYPNRRFRPDSEMEMFATFDCLYRPVGKDCFDRLGLDEVYYTGEGSKGVCKFSRHKVQSGKVSGSRIDCGPVFDLSKHWCVGCNFQGSPFLRSK